MSKNDFIVIGAGMAGLIAASMLRGRLISVLEKQPALPDNHSAVLRFRSPVVSDATGIAFEKVKAIKEVDRWRNSIADALAYSTKVTGIGMMRSITDQMGTVERFVAPPDFLAQLESASNPKILYSWDDLLGTINRSQKEGFNIISTIPMPIMERVLWASDPEVEYRHRAGANVVLTLGPSINGFATIYLPDPAIGAARLSLTRNVVSVEFYGSSRTDLELTEEAFDLACDKLGVLGSLINKVEVKQQPFAKILPIDEAYRRRTLVRMTDEFGIYSLGRYATWRPGLLLDDLVKDVRQIVAMADSKDRYTHRLKG